MNFKDLWAFAEIGKAWNKIFFVPNNELGPEVLNKKKKIFFWTVKDILIMSKSMWTKITLKSFPLKKVADIFMSTN